MLWRCAKFVLVFLCHSRVRCSGHCNIRRYTICNTNAYTQRTRHTRLFRTVRDHGFLDAQTDPTHESGRQSTMPRLFEKIQGARPYRKSRQKVRHTRGTTLQTSPLGPRRRTTGTDRAACSPNNNNNNNNIAGTKKEKNGRLWQCSASVASTTIRTVPVGGWGRSDCNGVSVVFVSALKVIIKISHAGGVILPSVRKMGDEKSSTKRSFARAAIRCFFVFVRFVAAAVVARKTQKTSDCAVSFLCHADSSSLLGASLCIFHPPFFFFFKGIITRFRTAACVKSDGATIEKHLYTSKHSSGATLEYYKRLHMYRIVCYSGVL